VLYIRSSCEQPIVRDIRPAWGLSEGLLLTVKELFVTKFYTGPWNPWLGILFTTASRTALEPTQPPMQWVPGALSLGVKRQGREADHSPPSSAEVKDCVKLYLHSSLIAFMVWCSVKAQEQLYLYLYFGTGLCPSC
jgi:hypothetical protein